MRHIIFSVLVVFIFGCANLRTEDSGKVLTVRGVTIELSQYFRNHEVLKESYALSEIYTVRRKDPEIDYIGLFFAVSEWPSQLPDRVQCEYETISSVLANERIKMVLPLKLNQTQSLIVERVSGKAFIVKILDSAENRLLDIEHLVVVGKGKFAAITIAGGPLDTLHNIIMDIKTNIKFDEDSHCAIIS